MNLQAEQLRNIARELPWTRPSTELALRIKSAILAAPLPERRPRLRFGFVAAGLVAAAASFVVFVRPAPRQAVLVEPSVERPVLVDPISIPYAGPALAVPEPERAAPAVAPPRGSPEPEPVEGQGESAVAADQSLVQPMEQTELRPVPETREIDRDQRAAPEPAARPDPPPRETRLERQKDRRDQRLDRLDRKLERHQKRVDRHAR